MTSLVCPASNSPYSNDISLKCGFTTNYQIFMLLSTVRSFAGGLRMSENLLSVDFEVFGRVQGVFFRKCTQDQAKSLGIKGWCKNTPQGSVQGQMQGPVKDVQLMKEWLKKTGSPQSQIEKAEFKNEHQISDYSFKVFEIIRKS